MPEYKYWGLPITPSIIENLIIELVNGQTLKRDNLVKKILDHHISNGGLRPEAQDFPRSVKKALSKLQEKLKQQTNLMASGLFIKMMHQFRLKNFQTKRLNWKSFRHMRYMDKVNSLFIVTIFRPIKCLLNLKGKVVGLAKLEELIVTLCLEFFHNLQPLCPKCLL